MTVPSSDHRSKMAKIELGIDRHQQFPRCPRRRSRATRMSKLTEDVERLELVPPRKAEMVVAPPARRRKEIDLVPGRSFEGPAVVLDRSLEHVQGVFQLVRWFGGWQASLRGPSKNASEIWGAKQVAMTLTQDFAR